MWIANTAAAAMMIPIVTAVLEELKKNKQKSGVDNKFRDQRTTREMSLADWSPHKLSDPAIKHSLTTMLFH